MPGVPGDGFAAAALALLAAAEPPAGRPLTGVVLLGEVGVVADEVAQQRQPLVPLRLRLGLDVQEVVAAPAAAATTLFSVNSFEIYTCAGFGWAINCKPHFNHHIEEYDDDPVANLLSWAVMSHGYRVC